MSQINAVSVLPYADRKHGEGTGRGRDQFPGRGFPAAGPGGEATQGRGKAGAVGIPNILHRFNSFLLLLMLLFIIL